MRNIILLPMIFLVLIISGCVQPKSNATIAPDEHLRSALDTVLIKSEKPRITSPSVGSGDISGLVEGNNMFAVDLYKVLSKQHENLLYAPYSVSATLAMIYAGARGNTAEQISNTLHFNLDSQHLHPVFNILDLNLDRRGSGNNKFQLNLANALWSQKGLEFLPGFLDTLAEHYDTGIYSLDFNEPQQSTSTINEWASRATNGKITNVISGNAINESTRFILTNAIYFKALWLHQFHKNNTSNDSFFLVDGNTVSVPMMEQTENFGYSDQDLYQVIELPYQTGSDKNVHDLSMVIILPNPGTFESFEDSLDSISLTALTAKLGSSRLHLTMPLFTFETSINLKDALREMGIKLLFSENDSDLSGIAETVLSQRLIFIQEVVQKAFIVVDEEGTEAAAVTATYGGITTTSEPSKPIEVKIDRPFIFFIRDVKTNTILFMGRVLNPDM